MDLKLSAGKEDPVGFDSSLTLCSDMRGVVIGVFNKWKGWGMGVFFFSISFSKNKTAKHKKL